MIRFSKDDLKTQPGMEHAFADYVRQIREEHDSSYNGMLDARFESCDFDGRCVTMSVYTADWMANPNGVLHGGVTASVMDLTMGLASRFFSGGRLTPTVNLNVSYLRPIALGQRLIIRAQVTMSGFHMCSVTGTAWLEDAPDKPVATAAGTYYVNHGNA